MTRAFAQLAALSILLASPAAAEIVDRGYTCTAPAFSMIGGIHGEGRGAVSLRLDQSYNAKSASFTYGVFDRVTGRMKMQATWALPTRQLDGSSVMTRFLIPLYATTADPPFGVGVTLDGKLVGKAGSSAGSGVIHFDRDGRRFAQSGRSVIASDATARWMPDLRTGKLLAYSVMGPGNKILEGELFLLPDWARAPKAVRAAMAAAERLRRKRKCDETFVLG